MFARDNFFRLVRLNGWLAESLLILGPLAKLWIELNDFLMPVESWDEEHFSWKNIFVESKKTLGLAKGFTT